MLTCSAELFLIGRNKDCWVTGRCAAKLIGGRGLFDGSFMDQVSSDKFINKSSGIKHYVYSE